MAHKKKSNKRDVDQAGQGTSGKGAGGDQVTVGQWNERRSVVRRAFPGPRGVDVPLRVALERRAFADIVAHAKEALDTEICGVLVGTACRDDDGEFAHVEAVVRGSRADEGSRHVTFTQDTWNGIHATIRREYPKLHIVGWYHSHPGFGVEFSKMDIFIQQNFFSGATQIGVLTDPLSGDVAVCMNIQQGIRYLPRFWVDGREHQCRVPAAEMSGTDVRGSATRVSPETIEALETRVVQMIHAFDDMRQTVYRWIYSLGILIGLAVVFFMARQISGMIFGDLPEPPSRISFAPVPVNVGGKACLLGVEVVSWQFPPDLLITAQEPAVDSAEETPTGKQPAESKSGNIANERSSKHKDDDSP